MAIFHPGRHMVCPLACICFYEGPQFVFWTAMRRGNVMEMRNRDIASVTQEVYNTLVIRARKLMRFEDHRCTKAFVESLVMDVWNELLDNAVRRASGIDCIQKPGAEILKPSVTGLWITNRENILFRKFRDWNLSRCSAHLLVYCPRCRRDVCHFTIFSARKR